MGAWKAGARRKWSEQLLEGGDADGSLKVLADGLRDSPGDRELHAGLKYHAHVALAALDKKGGPAAAIAHFKELVERFPKDKGLREAGFHHAVRAADDLGDAKKFAEAMKAADVYAPLAGGRAGEVKGRVFDAWGRALAADGKWEESLAKYAEGLRACPKDSRLPNNAIATVGQWAAKPVEEKNWKEVVRIYEVGLKHFPGDEHLKDAREFYANKPR